MMIMLEVTFCELVLKQNTRTRTTHRDARRFPVSRKTL